MSAEIQPSLTRSEVLREIKRNYPLALLCILPGVENRAHRMRSAAKKLGIESREFDRYRMMLLETGVWRTDGHLVETGFELLELGDLTVADFMSMNLNIISRLSGERSHEYEYLSVVTNRDLVRSFAAKVRKSLRELYEESRRLSPEEKTCVFSWTHAGAVELQVEKKTGGGDV